MKVCSRLKATLIKDSFHFIRKSTLCDSLTPPPLYHSQTTEKWMHLFVIFLLFTSQTTVTSEH